MRPEETVCEYTSTECDIGRQKALKKRIAEEIIITCKSYRISTIEKRKGSKHNRIVSYESICQTNALKKLSYFQKDYGLLENSLRYFVRFHSQSFIFCSSFCCSE